MRIHLRDRMSNRGSGRQSNKPAKMVKATRMRKVCGVCMRRGCDTRITYETGEGGIRTLGSLLSYGALAKRCFQPLSHLTKSKA